MTQMKRYRSNFSSRMDKLTRGTKNQSRIRLVFSIGCAPRRAERTNRNRPIRNATSPIEIPSCGASSSGAVIGDTNASNATG
jgi:hypothetical protein